MLKKLHNCQLFIILGVLTAGAFPLLFDWLLGRTFRTVHFVLFAAVWIGAFSFLYYLFIVTPCKSLLRTIQRATQGDYRARFSCQDENVFFKEISVHFNRLLSMVERQTNELTENRRLQKLLYENEKVYRSALELTCTRVFEADLSHNKILYGKEAYQKRFPHFQTEIYDELIRGMAELLVHPDDCALFLEKFTRTALTEQAQQNDQGEITLEYREKTEEGIYVWVESTFVPMNNKKDQTYTVIGYTKNIDDRKRAQLAILMQSQRDGLTGLYNKKVTQELVQTYLAGQGRSHTHAVIMLDIDNFKGINDTLGHLQGDIALMRVAEQLKKAFRDTDITGRIGGDEFLILMKDVHNQEALEARLQKLCKGLNSITLGEEGEYAFSGSIGVAFYPQNGTTYSELYQNADSALYTAKEYGKNQYCLCENLPARAYVSSRR